MSLLQQFYTYVTCPLLARKCTRAQIALLSRNMRRDVEVKDVHRQAHSCTGIRNIDHTCYVALNGGAGEQQVDLVVIVTCRQSQIL
jgi:uncharacterized NAD(P)/FAD-binding protein YdhS